MAEQWIEGILGYNHKNDRYGLLVTDLWEIDGFSCGNRLQVEIAGEWIDTHMEMDWSTGKGGRVDFARTVYFIFSFCPGKRDCLLRLQMARH